jgi:ERF superfamily
MIEGNGHDTYIYRTEGGEFYTPPKPLPAEIANAIANIQGEIKRLAKGEQNQHGGYAFTPVDDIYELMGPLLAKFKLVVTPYELRPPKLTTVEGPKGPRQFAEICVGFMLSVGEHSYADKHLCETLMIQVTGTQSFHAAKSFAQKTFFRGQWKIPTGEADLVDLSKQADDDERKVEQLKRKPKVEKLAHPASEKKRSEILNVIGKLKHPLSPQDQEAFLEGWGAVIDTLQPAHAQEVHQHYKAARG